MMASSVQADYKPGYTKVHDFTRYHLDAGGSARQTMGSAICFVTARGVSGFSERKI